MVKATLQSNYSKIIDTHHRYLDYLLDHIHCNPKEKVNQNFGIKNQDIILLINYL